MGWNKELVARAPAIITTGEVAAATLDLRDVAGAAVALDIRFTLGSLTNVIFRWYVSMDEVTWIPIESEGSGVTSNTISSSLNKSMNFRAPGWNYFRASVQGTGTTTGSSATLTYRYRRPGAL